jgi:hypothetical protein
MFHRHEEAVAKFFDLAKSRRESPHPRSLSLEGEGSAKPLRLFSLSHRERAGVRVPG